MLNFYGALLSWATSSCLFQFVALSLQCAVCSFCWVRLVETGRGKKGGSLSGL